MGPAIVSRCSVLISLREMANARGIDHFAPHAEREDYSQASRETAVRRVPVSRQAHRLASRLQTYSVGGESSLLRESLREMRVLAQGAEGYGVKPGVAADTGRRIQTSTLLDGWSGRTVLEQVEGRSGLRSTPALSVREHRPCRPARKEIVREGVPGIFHCWSRCVRRAYLLGKDPLTGKNHSHRRQWVIERLELLVANFVVDTCFLAVLSNHLHLVLRTTPRLVGRMGTWEVAHRWLRVFPGKRVLDGQWIEPTEQQVRQLAEDKEKIKKIRKRLASISWFMAALSEYIAPPQ